jgi:hypothetical protein
VRLSVTGWPEVRDVADLLDDAEMLDLRIGKGLVDRVDRAARHTGFIEQRDPLGGVAMREQLLDIAMQLVAVLRAQRAVL